MKLSISTEQGNLLDSLSKKMRAVAQTFEIAMTTHTKQVEEIELEAEKVWNEVAEQYDINVEEVDLRHVVIEEEHFIIAHPRGVSDVPE